MFQRLLGVLTSAGCALTPVPLHRVEHAERRMASDRFVIPLRARCCAVVLLACAQGVKSRLWTEPFLDPPNGAHFDEVSSRRESG